jgi:CDP-6-deoxy-D-xylo-4-hexulose-3-dehydrase
MNLGYLKAGDAIGFSALTWPTNVMPLIQIGLNPVPLDCSKNTLNVMQQDIAKRHEEIPLKAIFLTNALGFCGNLPQISSFCDDKNILVLEDNRESLGTVLPEGRTGNFSIASSFSFFSAHHISTIEGGAICTNNGDLSQMLRMIRANGTNRNLTEDQQKRLRQVHNIEDELRDPYNSYDLGFNLSPTEITGFLGLNQMVALQENISAREAIFTQLESCVLSNEDFVPLDHSHIESISPLLFPVICKDNEKAKYYMKLFTKAGVEIRPVLTGNIQAQPFYKKYVSKTYETPGADFIDRNGFCFGIYPELTDDEIAVLSKCLAG